MEYVEVSGSAAPPRLPAEYQEVEYIQSSGEQCLETNFRFTERFKYTMDYQATDIVANQRISGAYVFREGSSNRQMSYGIAIHNSYIRVAIPQEAACQNYTWYDVTAANLNRHTYTLDYLTKAIYLDGSSIYSLGDYFCYNDTAALGIICMRDSDGSSSPMFQNLCKGKLYSYKLELENSGLIHDLVPCYRKSDSKPGMYDLVSKTFFVNQGSGVDFTVGPNVSPKIPVTILPAWDTVHQVMGSFNYLTLSDIATPDDKTRVSVIKFSTGATVPTLSLPNTWNVHGLSSLVAGLTYEVIISYNSITQTVDCTFIAFEIVPEEYEFNYTGTAQTFELTEGIWKLEVWGAQGGYRGSITYGGKGGYSTGKLAVTSSLNCIIQVGGSGNTGGTSGGYNGGGIRDNYNGGGGATDIRISQDSLYARVIVAGGGGSDGASSRPGKAGGGTTGDSATESYGTGGGGGTQTAGGAGGNGNSGSFGLGGRGISANSGHAGAGGGGWYGGGGSCPDGSADDDRGGGGGSGYVYTAETAANYPEGCLLNPSYYLTETSMLNEQRVGNGYCKITRIS